MGGNATTRRFRKIGFFHFGADDQSDPIRSLRTSLLEASTDEDLGDCLIVTPEAFNIRNGYWNPADRSRDPLIARSLREISTHFKVALVAGLIEEGRCGEAGYSCAYLIDGDVCRVLSRKVEPDLSANYKPCPDNCDKPVLHRDVCIGALICMDAAGFTQTNERHKAFLEKIGSFNARHTILCVPSRMDQLLSREVALAWPPHITVVVGNSGYAQPSVIRHAGRHRDRLPVCFQEDRNKVHVVALE